MNVVPMKRKARAERREPKTTSIITHPLSRGDREEDCIGMLEQYDGYVVVRALTEEREWRKIRGERRLLRKTMKYIVDTRIEGVRLLLRVNGLHHATVQQAPDGFRVHVPPVPAGDAP